MRVQKVGEGNPVDGHFYIIYDETKSNDEEEKAKVAERLKMVYIPEGCTRQEFIDSVFKSSKKLGKSIFRRANGHPTICEFNIRPDKEIVFGFAEQTYSINELKIVMRKAKAALARLTKSNLKRKEL